MLEFLSPRRVAARKIARLIARSQLSRSVTLEAKAEGVAAPQLDSLERLLEQELGKYGLAMGAT